jgi:hypothetical protein
LQREDGVAVLSLRAAPPLSTQDDCFVPEPTVTLAHFEGTPLKLVKRGGPNTIASL